MRLAAGLVALLLGTSAQADSRSEARALLREGNRLLEKGEYAGALELYQAAYARFPSPKILLNLGTVLRQLNREAEALEAYEKFLSEPTTDRRAKSDVENIVATLRAAVRPVLQLQVDPAGARVFIDGSAVGEAPIDRPLDAGSHILRVEKEGFLPTSATVTLKLGEKQVVSLRLAPNPPATSSPGLPGDVLPPAAAAPEIPPPRRGEPEASGPSVAVRETINHEGQLGLTVRSETDARTGEAGAAAGLTWGLRPWLELGALALIQEAKGVRGTGAFLFRPDSALKPFGRIGVPVFFPDGAVAGIHGAAGLLWDLATHAGVSLDVGVEHFPTMPSLYHKTAVVVGLGVQVRAF